MGISNPSIYFSILKIIKASEYKILYADFNSSSHSPKSMNEILLSNLLFWLNDDVI